MDGLNQIKEPLLWQQRKNEAWNCPIRTKTYAMEYKGYKKRGHFISPPPSVHATGINVQIWWEPPPTNIASIPVSAALSLNDFKQGRLHGSQTLLTYMQGNITVKTRMEVFFSTRKTHEAYVCVWERALRPLCASVSLCICVCRGHVYKESSTRCHTSADSTGITRTSHVFLGPSWLVIEHLPRSQLLFHFNLYIFHHGQIFYFGGGGYSSSSSLTTYVLCEASMRGQLGKFTLEF